VPKRCSNQRATAGWKSCRGMDDCRWRPGR